MRTFSPAGTARRLQFPVVEASHVEFVPPVQVLVVPVNVQFALLPPFTEFAAVVVAAGGVAFEWLTVAYLMFAPAAPEAQFKVQPEPPSVTRGAAVTETVKSPPAAMVTVAVPKSMTLPAAAAGITRL